MKIEDIKTDDIIEMKIFDFGSEDKLLHHLVTLCKEMNPKGFYFEDLRYIKDTNDDEQLWTLSYSYFDEGKVDDFYKIKLLGTKKENPEYWL